MVLSVMKCAANSSALLSKQVNGIKRDEMCSKLSGIA
jgi:hypothetical protein